MKVVIENACEVYDRVPTELGGSCHVRLPKSCLWRKVKVVVLQDENVNACGHEPLKNLLAK